MNKTLFIAFFFLPYLGESQYKVPAEILKGLETIDSNIIKKHVSYLSDNKLRGRYPGTEGYQMAVDYVIAKFKESNIMPAGEEGTFLQKVLLRKSKINRKLSQITINLANGNSKKMVLGEDLIIFPNPEKKTVDIQAPLVFVGPGFDAPKFGFNDYNGMDVKGKIVVILRKTPEKVSENVKRHLTYNSTYQQFAEKNGAIGVLLCNYVTTPVQFKIGANAIMDDGIEASINGDGTRASSSYMIGGKIQFMGRISVQFLKELMDSETKNFSEIWQKMENGNFVSMHLKSTISGHYENTFSDINGINIIGKIEGSDKKLKKQFVIHSGHLDHLGIGVPINGDSIYNGAHDNASGIASSLEIARMYANLKVKPKRSILFVFVTGEEMGLLGSGYFMANPTVPKANLVADVNTDMPTIIAPLMSVAPLGAEHSSLQGTVEQAAALLDIKVETDPEPAEGRFVRSDQYNFMKGGVPALHIKYGYSYNDPALHLAEKVKRFREKNYHKPSDELNDSFVWAAGRKYAQLNFLVGYIIAQTKEKPTFNKEDFFNPKYYNR